jgi:hypothetical protein
MPAPPPIFVSLSSSSFFVSLYLYAFVRSRSHVVHSLNTLLSSPEDMKEENSFFAYFVAKQEEGKKDKSSSTFSIDNDFIIFVGRSVSR